MYEKRWWQSRTIWVNLVSFVAAMLVLLGVELDVEAQAQLVAGVMAVVNVVTIVLRKLTTKEITSGK